MRTIAFLLLVACAARAQDSLVERLETELRALVSRADAAAEEALVVIPQRGWAEHWIKRPGHAGANAILVGKPARVVAPYSAVGEVDRAMVRLADGRIVAATRWGGDPDL